MLINRPLVENSSHKTAIVLDRSPKFSSPAGVNIALQFKDDHGEPFSGTLEKTMWNCSVEAALELYRVVADLFPNGTRQLRFVVSDFVGRFLTPAWSNELIGYVELLNALSSCDAPQASADASSCSIMNGIAMAVEALSERTPHQRRAHALCMDNYLRRSEAKRRDSFFCAISNSAASKELHSLGGSGSEIAPRRKPLVATPPISLNRIYMERGRHRSAEATHRGRGGKLHQRHQRYPLLHGGEVAEESANIGDFLGEDRSWRDACRLRNRGTIIVLTTLDSSEDFDRITDSVVEQVNARNESVKVVDDENLLIINHVDLYIVNILDRIKEAVRDRFLFQGFRKNVVLSATLTSVSGGASLISTIHKTMQDVYDLVSTTISGIPMKEEAQQGQSVNYDVELLHHRDVHTELFAHGLLESNSKILARNEHQVYNTICLKWCTAGPKFKSDKFPLVQNSCALTPTNVNSRPTVCLTSFVLAGKCVMLEVNREAIDPLERRLEPNLHQKLISHYLCRDEVSGSLVIRSVAMGHKAELINIPATMDVDGEFRKSALNYTIMRQLMNAAALTVNGVVDASSTFDAATAWAAELAQNIQNLTHYFPTSLRNSFIFHFAEKFESVFFTLQKVVGIKPEEFDACRASIDALISAQNSGDPLTMRELDSIYVAGKALPKSEQFRIAFEELAKVMHNYIHCSTQHKALFDYFMEKSGVHPSIVLATKAQAKAVEQHQPPGTRGVKRPLDDKTNLAELFGEDNDGSNGGGAVDSTTVSVVPAKKMRKQYGPPWTFADEINLLAHFNNAYDRNRWVRWKEFVGREQVGDQAQNALYPNLKLNENAETTGVDGADAQNVATITLGTAGGTPQTQSGAPDVSKTVAAVHNETVTGAHPPHRQHPHHHIHPRGGGGRHHGSHPSSHHRGGGGRGGGGDRRRGVSGGRPPPPGAPGGT